MVGLCFDLMVVWFMVDGFGVVWGSEVDVVFDCGNCVFVFCLFFIVYSVWVVLVKFFVFGMSVLFVDVEIVFLIFGVFGVIEFGLV